MRVRCHRCRHGSHEGRGRGDETGLALIMVMGVALVVMLIAIASFKMATGALSSSARHVNYEQAVHVAEHGVDQTLARLQQDELHTTPAGVPNAPSFADEDAEETWARAQIALAPTAVSPKGEYAVVKPLNRNVLYVQSWVPNRDNEVTSRLLKAEYPRLRSRRGCSCLRLRWGCIPSSAPVWR